MRRNLNLTPPLILSQTSQFVELRVSKELKTATESKNHREGKKVAQGMNQFATVVVHFVEWQVQYRAVRFEWFAGYIEPEAGNILAKLKGKGW